MLPALLPPFRDSQVCIRQDSHAACEQSVMIRQHEASTCSVSQRIVEHYIGGAACRTLGAPTDAQQKKNVTLPETQSDSNNSCNESSSLKVQACYLMLSPGVDILPKSASACSPSLWAGLGPTAGSEGGAAGVPPSMPNMRSSGGGASMSSSGGAPAFPHHGTWPKTRCLVTASILPKCNIFTIRRCGTLLQ